MTYVDKIILKFGGVRPLAREIGKTASTVSGWKSRGTIPDGEKPGVLNAARGLSIDLRPEHFFPQTETPLSKGERGAT